MSDDEGVEPGTPEFEAAAMEGLMSNRALPWADRVACGQKAIDILRALLVDAKGPRTSDQTTLAFMAREFAIKELHDVAVVVRRSAARYSQDGEREYSAGMRDSVLDIDERIRALVAERAATGPHTWELPSEPGPEVKAVRDESGDVWYRNDDGWALRGGAWRAWSHVIRYGPLTDATGEVEDGG